VAFAFSLGCNSLPGYCFCPDSYGPDEAQQFTLSKLRDESSQLAAVDLLSSVFRPNTLEVDHRRFDISVTEPSLHSSDINTVTQMVGSESVLEFMQEEVHAVWSLSAFVAVLCHTLLAIEA